MSARAFRRWAIRASGAAIGLALLAPLATAVAGRTGAQRHVTAQDRSATHAYFAALYAYRSAEVANVTGSVATLRRFAARLGAECAGVMSNAPREMAFPSSAEGAPPSPRQIGEHDRQSRQRDDLEEEMTRAMAIALLEPDRQATLAYVASLKSLQWTNPDVTAVVRAAAANLESAFAGPPLDVCADMRIWVASGYYRLSPATRAFIQAWNDLQTRIAASLRGGRLGGLEAMSHYEGPAEKALVRRLRLLDRQQQPLFEAYFAEAGRLARALGLSQEEEASQPEGPPKGAVVVGHGRTAAGTGYTIRVLPKPSHPPGSHKPPCPVNISIETTESFGSRNGSRIVGSSAGEECLSRSRRERPRARCDDGRIVVEGQARNDARAVKLRLSNGRQIFSRVTIVPRGLGGPLGFYYQAVKGPAPYPVSLVELDRHGRRLSTQRLDRIRECTAHPVHVLPHGIRTLVRARVPGGPAFSIVGKHYRFQGRLHFKLSLELEEGAEASGSSSSFFFGSRERSAHYLEWQIETGCSPHEYAILYGLSTKPRDAVWARVAGTLQPFHEVRIPASLHAGGVLVYVVLPELPREVVVHAPDGKTVAVEALGDAGRELTEQCEGEAEPA